MSDGTRVPSGGWLDGLCPPELREHLDRTVEFGSAVALLVAWWADAAAGLISEFEAGIRDRDLPEEVLETVTRLVGIDRLDETGHRVVTLADAVSQSGAGAREPAPSLHVR